MSDVFPRRNLPDDGKGHSAEPWGREVEKRIVGNESSLLSLQQSFQGQNRNTASSLGDLATQASNLARQVQDLAGRVSYSVSNPSLSQQWNTPTSTPYAWGPAVSFTLTEPRVVAVQSIVNGTVYTAATATTTAAFAFLQGALFVDGSVVTDGARGQMGTNVGSAPNTNRTSTYDGVIISRTLVTLGTGAHTVQGGFNQRNAEVIGGTGTAYVIAAAPAVFVDVLQLG